MTGRNISRNATNKYDFVYIVCTFVLRFKRSKRLSLFRPFIIYAVTSLKSEMKECYSRMDGNNSTYSPAIESLEISLRSIENKYVCRDCVAK